MYLLFIKSSIICCSLFFFFFYMTTNSSFKNTYNLSFTARPRTREYLMGKTQAYYSILGKYKNKYHNHITKFNIKTTKKHTKYILLELTKITSDLPAQPLALKKYFLTKFRTQDIFENPCYFLTPP